MKRRAAFSLVEAIVAITILGMAVSALLLATQASSTATDDALDRTVASGLAQQIIDEIMGRPYKEASAPVEVWPLGLDAGESPTSSERIQFDDIDDYHDYTVSPPAGPWGIPLGSGNSKGGYRNSALRLPNQFWNGWSVTVDVRYVDPDELAVDLTTGSTSEYRAVIVTVHRSTGTGSRTLEKVRRVCSYVPPLD